MTYDLSGQKFGRLTVLERAGSCNRGALWRCMCDCGNEKIACSTDLRNGDTKSCGCLHSEIVRKKMMTHGATIGRRNNTGDGRLYNVWGGMMNRTRDKNATNYKWYGGAGISVCDEWHDFKNFMEWSKNNGYNPDSPKGECTLDRIDSSGNYCPDNCRWVSMKVQANNQKSNRIIDYDGESHNMKQWSEILGINYSTFKKYIYNGLGIQDMIKNNLSKNSIRKTQ